ncbi:MAG: hypothetical protein ACYC23_16745, partial [Limisphaerales bacterium]
MNYANAHVEHTLAGQRASDGLAVATHAPSLAAKVPQLILAPPPASARHLDLWSAPACPPDRRPPMTRVTVLTAADLHRSANLYGLLAQAVARH